MSFRNKELLKELLFVLIFCATVLGGAALASSGHTWWFAFVFVLGLIGCVIITR